MSNLNRSAFQGHPFHLVSPSPWPIFTCISLLTLTTSGVLTMHGFSSAGNWLFCAFALLVSSMFFWFRDVISEGTYLGNHTLAVQRGLNMGVALFIVSEALFFLAIFWAYFHSALSPTAEVGAQWPPMGIEAINAFELPLLNTALLLASGVTVTYSHHSLIEGNRNAALNGAFFTILSALVSPLIWTLVSVFGIELDTFDYLILTLVCYITVLFNSLTPKRIIRLLVTSAIVRTSVAILSNLISYFNIMPLPVFTCVIWIFILVFFILLALARSRDKPVAFVLVDSLLALAFLGLVWYPVLGVFVLFPISEELFELGNMLMDSDSGGDFGSSADSDSSGNSDPGSPGEPDGSSLPEGPGSPGEPGSPEEPTSDFEDPVCDHPQQNIVPHPVNEQGEYDIFTIAHTPCDNIDNGAHRAFPNPRGYHDYGPSGLQGPPPVLCNACGAVICHDCAYPDQEPSPSPPHNPGFSPDDPMHPMHPSTISSYQTVHPESYWANYVSSSSDNGSQSGNDDGSQSGSDNENTNNDN